MFEPQVSTELHLVSEDSTHAADPRQLELFAPESPRLVLEDSSLAVQAVTVALQRGRTVRLKKGPAGFELCVVPEPALECSPSGFSRRAADLLARCTELPGRDLWARRAGGAWAEWNEWGTL